MRVRRPRLVKCDGARIRIEWPKRELGQLERGYAIGGMYYHNAHGGPKILMAPNTSRRGEQNTLLHELGHHFWRRAGFQNRFAPETQELVIDELMSWTLATLRENPALTRFLLEKTP